MNCPNCGKSEMVATQKEAAVSVGGILGVLVCLAGAVLLLQSTTTGLITILVGILIGTLGRPKHTVMVCPACRHKFKL